MQTPHQLNWQSYSSGRLYVAVSALGFYELEPGERVTFCRVENGLLMRTDLGPCLQATLQACMEVCEEHRRNAGKG